MTTLITALSTDSAQDDLDAEITGLEHEAQAHPAIHHPFLTWFGRGAYRDQAAVMRRYAVEYSGYSCWFPQYLKTVISRLESHEHRALLQRNLEEEQGKLGEDDCEELRRVGIDPDSVMGIPHPVLFRRFCHSLGIADWELAEPSAAAREWRTRFLQFLHGATAAQAVGALGLGTEHVVKPIYRQLLAGIVGLGTLRRQDFVFFELHCLVDDQHQLDLREIARDLAATPTGVAELRSGMRTALDLRCEFWNQLHHNVMATQLANPA